MNKFLLGRTGVFILPLICILITACATNEATQQTNEATQQTPQYQQWKNQAVQHYRYQLEIHYAPQEPLVVNIEVRNGKVVSETDATTSGPVEPSRSFPPYSTIHRLFDVIEEAQQRGASDIQVVYDPALGYPTRIMIDEMSNATDDSISYTIRAFKRLD